MRSLASGVVLAAGGLLLASCGGGAGSPGDLGPVTTCAGTPATFPGPSALPTIAALPDPFQAAHEIWQALGIPDHMGVSQIGDHDHCVWNGSQQPEVTAYVRKFLIGGGSDDTNVLKTDGSYPFDQATWAPWSIPNLAGSTSFDSGVDGSSHDAAVDMSVDLATDSAPSG